MGTLILPYNIKRIRAEYKENKGPFPCNLLNSLSTEFPYAGEIPIGRIALDNVALCEELGL